MHTHPLSARGRVNVTLEAVAAIAYRLDSQVLVVETADGGVVSVTRHDLAALQDFLAHLTHAIAATESGDPSTVYRESPHAYCETCIRDFGSGS